MEQNEIFTTGRHKELNEEKFNSIIKDIQDFAELAKYSETAYLRLMNIMIAARVEYKLIRR
jgi:DNA-binding SARP family transcriptional activator